MSMNQYRNAPDHTEKLSLKPSRGGGFGPLIPIRSAEERQQENKALQLAAQQQLFDRVNSVRRGKPSGYERPAFNTPQYWRDCAQGWISDEEQRKDHADFESRRRRALDSKHNKASAPHRHDRSAPRVSKQFSKPMSTQAARDDRLTPQSKALLQVLVARTGRGRYTDTTKTTLGVIMNRCPRSIQRYVQELIKFGYIRTQTRKSRRTGFFIGLRVWIMNSVRPFFAREDTNYDPENWWEQARNPRKSVETEESLTKVKDRILNTIAAKKPPWFREFVSG